MIPPSRGTGLLYEIESAGAANDSEACIPFARACGLGETGFDFIAIFLAFVGENSTGLLPGGNDAAGGQLGVAILLDLALDQEVPGLSRRATISPETAVVNDACKLPGVTRCISFCRTGEIRQPFAVEAPSRSPTG